MLSFDPSGIVDGLDALGITTLVYDAAPTLDDAYAQFEQLGAATGHVGDAAESVARISSELEEIAATVPERDEPLTYYHEIDDTLFTATSSTFVGDLYALAGLENIADSADDGSGFPQLSAELIVDADPDLIFLADTICCGQDAETVAARAGWANLTAVRDGQVIELDDDIASRWGPRVADFLRTVVAAVAGVPVSTGS